jgi:hypothetical protein
MFSRLSPFIRGINMGLIPKNHPMNIPTKFGYNWPGGVREED